MAAIEVQGLADLRRDLLLLDRALPNRLKAANRRAAELIAERARGSFAARTGVAPKVAASVRVLAQQAGAAIKLGGNAFPYALGSEFGAIRYTQFPPFKHKPDSGYSLFPAIREKKDEAEKMITRDIDGIVGTTFGR